jgi:two-component sensor histidine kinase
VAWRRDGAALRLTWGEAGGPAVALQPDGRGGFGRTLIERAVAHELAGEARLEFRPGGVAYELRAPLERLAAAA